jgi:hypothetical protein
LEVSLKERDTKLEELTLKIEGCKCQEKDAKIVELEAALAYSQS